MKYSYNWLKDYIAGKMPSPQKLADFLMGSAFEIDSLEKKGSDWILDIKVLSNRAPDCLSHIGIAREIAAITNCKLKMPACDSVVNKKHKANDFIAVKIDDKKDCARYTASVVLGVKVGDSPKYMRDRLTACGLQGLNNIVDITNFVMLETGQPLHAFDLDKISERTKKTIIVRRAKRGEYIKTLDKEKTNIPLDESVLVIADGDRPIAIAGIKGGLDTGIDEKTKNIVVEAANFNSVLIRRASQKLKIRTDASWRFENGLDANLIDFAQKRVVHLIQKIAKGEPALGIVDVRVALPAPKKIQLDFAYLNSLLGAEPPKTIALKILQSLGCKIIKKTADSLLVEAPSQRLDLKTQEDLIEEIGRLWGLAEIPKVFPKVILGAPVFNKNLAAENKAKDVLAKLRFSEAYNYTFIGDTEKEIFDFKDEELWEIANPVSELNKYLRPSLRPYLLRNVKENLKNFSEVKMFEIGKVFSKKDKEQETLRLGLVMAGKEKAEELFFQAKGVLEAVLAELGASNFSLDSCLNIVDKNLLEKLGIKANVILAEIDFEEVIRRSGEQKKYQLISVYPSSLRDIAVLTPQETKALDVLEVIKSAAGKLLVELELFDVYAGASLPEGKKNLAFHLTYQSQEKTLSAQEIDEIQQKIFTAVEIRGWQVRK